MATSSRNELVVTTTKELEPIKGGVELAIVLYTLLLPTEPMEVHVVVFSIQVEVLKEPIIPKPIPLTLLEIGVSVEVTLIDSVIHAFEIFKTPNTILKDTHVMEKPNPQLIPLREPVDDLVARVK